MTDLFEYSSRRDADPGYPPGVPPDVCKLFEEFALNLISTGWTRYSADALLHRIRWHHHVERANRAFKCNDHHTAPLARWFLARHPEHKGFFELRERLHDGYHEEGAI
jgi:hypothetical protein